MPSRADRPHPVLDHPLVLRALTLVVVAVAWELGAASSSSLMIPGFFETVLAGAGLLVGSQLWSALAVSNQALVIGFPLAILTGVPIGLAMGRNRSFERATNVYVNILLVTPMAAITPLLLMSLGIGLASRVVLVYVFSVVMIVVNARSGIRQVDPSLLEMATSYGATERELWSQVLLPGALPAVMTGIRIGLGRAVTGMVIGELLLVSVGIGGLILRYRGLFQGAKLYATVVVVVIEALLLISLAQRLETRLIPWAKG